VIAYWKGIAGIEVYFSAASADRLDSGKMLRLVQHGLI